MKKVKREKFMLLQKKVLTFLAIALFSVLLINPLNISAATFEYDEFDWDSFVETHQEYWDGYCDEEDEECKSEILQAQKKFFTKFYKMMAKYEKKGKFLSKEQATMVETIILETVFFEMNPTSFADSAEKYKEEWSSASGAYTIDEDDLNDPNIEVNYEDETAAEYFAEEKDTLKTLLKNMFAYTTNCYGVQGDPLVEVLNDGSKRYYCENGGSIVNIPTGWLKREDKCVHLLGSHEKGFWEYFVSKWAHDIKIPLNKQINFLKRSFVDGDYNTCMALESEYAEGTNYVYEDDEHISVDRYFDFLSFNIYFDKKAHLQSYFYEEILEPAGVSCMTNDICTDSLEAAGLYADYEEEIIEARQEIIAFIIQILNNYGISVTYNEGISGEFVEATLQEVARKRFYWPIGSDETEERDGRVFADKDPASTEVISYYGPRTNPVTGEEEYHYGIDIAGVDGETNVIAVYDGEVISIVNNCTSGDYSCNEGYGNTIIISHSNGDYTVYAQLASVDSNISVGSSVLQGQLIGKVGSTGNTMKSALHYELRVGGNDVSYAVNPLDTMSADNPRPAALAGDFSSRTTALTREEFINLLRAYCNEHYCPDAFRTYPGVIYDVSEDNNVNPEFVVVRAVVEGFSPGESRHNYWGIGCTNEGDISDCHKYDSFEAGIKGFANLSIIKNSETVSDVMSSGYAYIGAYWYNPGAWSYGGCIYFPHIKQYMSSSRANYVGTVCGEGPSCPKGGGNGCTKTTDEDQKAYIAYQMNDEMVPLRYNIFGL